MQLRFLVIISDDSDKTPINQISVLQLKVGVKNILEKRWQHKYKQFCILECPH